MQVRRCLPSVGMSAKYGNIDKVLQHWLLKMVDERGVLCLHAENGDESFKASDCWLSRWQRRYKYATVRACVTD